MKQARTEADRQRREHALWFTVLKFGLPVFAAMIAALFVLVCVAYGRVRPIVTIELGENSPEASAFLRSDAFDARYRSEPEIRYKKAGDYRLYILTGNMSVPVRLQVKDTVSPAADAAETTVPVNRTLTPDKLIRNLKDQSVVKISFENAPAFGTIGDYDAVVLLEDESGNTARVNVPVHVRAAVDEVICEAGDPVPEQRTFLIGTYETVEMTEITEAMMHEPGEYPIGITADGVETGSRLVVRDTVPPTANGTTRVVLPGEEVTPDMLVSGLFDETEVKASFVSAPDPEVRTPQTIGIELVDRGGNETTVTSTVLYSSIAPVKIEARRSPLEVTELIAGADAADAALSETFVPSVPGTYLIPVTVGGEQNLAVVEVEDTTPPVIAVQKTDGFTNTPLPPEALVSAEDVTETVLSYADEPDWSIESQEVTVTAVDVCGNRSEKRFTLTLKPDTEPPVLYGVKNRFCYVGEPVSYLAEVSATDNCDEEVKIEVDASEVDDSRRGNYRVTYSATDRAGNTVRKTVTFKFIRAKVDDDEAQEIADKIIAKILTDDMTLAEQIEAIYNYVHNHITYNPKSNKQDWRSEAVRGLTTGKGDCFTSYSAARLLLEQTDAQILSVQRAGANTHHYWMLVNIGTGWYHFDPSCVGASRQRCFMWTTEQTRRVSKTYWGFNESLYPPVATEPYNGGK